MSQKSDILNLIGTRSPQSSQTDGNSYNSQKSDILNYIQNGRSGQSYASNTQLTQPVQQPQNNTSFLQNVENFGKQALNTIETIPGFIVKGIKNIEQPVKTIEALPQQFTFGELQGAGLATTNLLGKAENAITSGSLFQNEAKIAKVLNPVSALILQGIGDAIASQHWQVPERFDLTKQTQAQEQLNSEALAKMPITGKVGNMVGNFIGSMLPYAFASALTEGTVGESVLIPTAEKIAPKLARLVPKVSDTISFLGLDQIAYDPQTDGTRMQKLKSDLIMLVAFEAGGYLVSKVGEKTASLVSKTLKSVSEKFKGDNPVAINDIAQEVDVAKNAIKADTGKSLPEVYVNGIAEAKPKDLEVAGKNITEQDVLNELQANKEELVNKYIQENGNLIGSDEAKKVFTGYTDETAGAYHKASTVIRDEAYDKLLAEKKGTGNNTVMFTAGGTGAGKSETLKFAQSRSNFPIIYDSTFGNLKNAREVIQKAIDNGYKARIGFVYSNPVAAWERVLQRGRYVPEEAHITYHRDTLENIKKLYQEFGNNPDVRFSFYDNSGKLGEAKQVPFDFINKIGYNEDNVRKSINEITDKAIKEENTSEVLANKYSEARQDRPGNDRQPQQSDVGTVRQQTEDQVGQTPSKIAKSIERKSIEQGLTDNFDGLAGYDKITIKDQAERAAKVMETPEEAMAIIRGEKPLPEGLRGTALITAVEEQIKKTGDAHLAYELANSPLVSGTSAAAQEMRLAAEREPDSLAIKMHEIKQAKLDGIRKRLGKNVDQAIADNIKKARSYVKKPDRYDWNNFLDSIQC